MIIKDITEQKQKKKGVILPFAVNNIFQIKINKSIEIVIVPNPGEKNAHQDNVGIILEENKILNILLKRYKHVLITVINTKKDLIKLAKRKPDLVFSGVKYFNFNGEKIWLNDYLETNHIPYIASSKKALDNESEEIFSTQTLGLNPQMLSNEILNERIKNNFDIYKNRKLVNKLFFYGAGCGVKDTQNRILKVFKSIFLNIL